MLQTYTRQTDAWLVEHEGVVVELAGEGWTLERASGRVGVLRTDDGRERRVHASALKALYFKQNRVDA